MLLDEDHVNFLTSHGLGRLATVATGGGPQNKPVGYRYNAELGTIDIGGFAMERSAKYRNIVANPMVSFVVDDSVGQGAEAMRFVEVRGRAEQVPAGPDAGGPVIRIHPARVISWSIPGHPGLHTVGSTPTGDPATTGSATTGSATTGDPAFPGPPGDGVITKASPQTVAETVARFSGLAKAKGLRVFAVIDQAAEARQAGLALRDTVLVIFGNPAAGTPVMAAAPLSSLDLPLKFVVWDDGGVAKVSYVSPQTIAARYGLDAALAANLAAIGPLTDALVAP